MKITTNTFKCGQDFRDGVLLIVDKPLGWTSFDVVNKLRYTIRKRFSFKKIKVGHAGTLDPLATGLLVICVGKMTKQINQFVVEQKSYTGTIKLGATTPSYDLETEIDARFETGHISRGLLEEVRKQFVGEVEQMPPMFSAKKVDGVRAYEAARKGNEVKLKKAQIRIDKLEFTRIELPEVDFDMTCSKGTYVRSLAFDIGKTLKSGAHLTSLRRTASGVFRIEDAWNLDDLIQMISNMDFEIPL